MVEINWTKQAIKDIDKIADFIAKDSEYYAEIQVKRFFESVKILVKYPFYGKMVPEKQEITIREVLSGNYRISIK